MTAVFSSSARERPTLEVLEHHEGAALVDAHFVNDDDVLVVELSRGACLDEEALGPLRVDRLQELHCDAPPEARVACEVDDAHAAASEPHGSARIGRPACPARAGARPRVRPAPSLRTRRRPRYCRSRVPAWAAGVLPAEATGCTAGREPGANSWVAATPGVPGGRRRRAAETWVLGGDAWGRRRHRRLGAGDEGRGRRHRPESPWCRRTPGDVLDPSRPARHRNGGRERRPVLALVAKVASWTCGAAERHPFRGW